MFNSIDSQLLEELTADLDLSRPPSAVSVGSATSFGSYYRGSIDGPSPSSMGVPHRSTSASSAGRVRLEPIPGAGDENIVSN